MGYGIYTFNCVAYDIDGNYNFSIITVTVNDTINPELNQPSDVSYFVGSTGNVIVWFPTDYDPNQYQVLMEGTLYSTYFGSWISGDDIIVNVDGLTEGSYNFTIIVNDTKGNTAIDMVNVTVTSSNPPLVSHPLDISYTAGDLGTYQISWVPEDADPNAYTIYNNSIKIDSNNWTSLVPIVLDVSGLAEGTYYYEIILNDTMGNNASDLVIVSVHENLPPTIIGPNNLTYNIGSTGNVLQWNITDMNPGNYTIYKNGSFIKTASWSSGVNVSLNVDGLDIGAYLYELVAFDLYGNNASDFVVVTVIDNSNPSISTNDSIVQYLEGTTGHSITWYADDDSKAYYVILRNGTTIESDVWTSTTIVVNIDGLSVGAYNFTAIVFDSQDNQNFSESTVIVYENTPPTIDQPASITYEVNYGTGQQIVWDAYDENPYMYEIINATDNNGTILETNTWIGGVISYDVSGLSVGNYSFKCRVIDKFMNNASSTVLVTVIPPKVPILSHPVDINYEGGQTGIFINWTAWDDTLDPNNPKNYTIYNESTISRSGIWNSSGENIVIDVGGMTTVGFYNFTIIVFDEDGNNATDTVNVSVIAGAPPVFTGVPDDKIIIEGSTGNFLSWQANSSSICKNYTIYLDGSQVKFGNWTDNESISRLIDTDSLSAGVYYYVLRVYNLYGFAEDEVKVTVIDMTNPVITPLPDVEYDEGSTGNNLTWTVTDLHPNNYEILVNYGSGYVLEETGIWTNNITFDIDGFVYGIYFIKVVAYDQHGNSEFDIVKLTVKDTTAPIFSAPLPSRYISGYSEGTDVLWAVWNAHDEHPETYMILRNSSILINAPWSGTSIIYNVGGLTFGTYEFTCILFLSRKFLSP